MPICRASSVRRILKRGGQELQKIWEEQRSESEIVPPKFSPIFCPKLGEEQKKKSSLKFPSISSPKPKRKAQNIPFVWSNLMPNLRRGGGACLIFAYFSRQFYNPGDPKGGPWHNAPPKYAPVQSIYPLQSQKQYEKIKTLIKIIVIRKTKATVIRKLFTTLLLLWSWN